MLRHIAVVADRSRFNNIQNFRNTFDQSGDSQKKVLGNQGSVCMIIKSKYHHKAGPRFKLRQIEGKSNTNVMLIHYDVSLSPDHFYLLHPPIPTSHPPTLPISLMTPHT